MTHAVPAVHRSPAIRYGHPSIGLKRPRPGRAFVEAFGCRAQPRLSACRAEATRSRDSKANRRAQFEGALTFAFSEASSEATADGDSAKTQREQSLGEMPCRGRVPAMDPTFVSASFGRCVSFLATDHSDPPSEPKSFIPLVLITATTFGLRRNFRSALAPSDCGI